MQLKDPLRRDGGVHVILTVTVLLLLLEFLDELIIKLLTAWGAVGTEDIVITNIAVVHTHY